MKYCTLILTIFISFAAAAQSRAFRGRVVDNNNKGVPFAVIEAKERHEGVYTDENGYFAFTADTATVKTLAIFCLGFEQKELLTASLSQDSLLIRLQPKATMLKTVQITARGGRRRHDILGKNKRSLRHDGDAYRNYGAETAIKLKADTGRYEAELKSVYVYIAKDGNPDTRFRVHVYEWGELPEKDITDTNLIVKARKGGAWTKIDLSDKHIPVGEGVFISVEWISGFGNSEIQLQSTFDKEVTGFNGQVLGITAGYGQPSITYSRKPFSSTWEYFDAAEARRKGGYFLNPMIFGTYTYYK